MTDRGERFLRACRRLPVDATPVWFMRQAGRSLPEYRAIRERATLADIVGDATLCAEVSLQPVDRLGVDAAIVFADITTPLPGAGIAVELVDGVGPVIAEPIRTVADLDRLRPFDPSASVGPLLEAIGLLRMASPVPVIGFAGAPFTLAAYLVEGRSPRGLERTKTMLHTEPALWAGLLERLVDLDLAYLRAQDYRAAVAPHVRRLLDGLVGLGVPIIQFGTSTAGLLAAMAETGGDVIGLDWRIGLAEGWARVPDRAVQGNLDPAILLAGYEAAEAATDAILDEAGGRPGHIFNLGHGVLPGTDPDHLRRLVDRVHERTARIGIPV